MRFRLRVAGESVDVTAGESFDLVIDGQTHAAKLSVLPTRRFELDEFRFDYPRHMSFEHEKTSGMRMWTLDGNDTVLMLFAYPIRLAGGDLARKYFDELPDQFDPRELDDPTIELDDRMITGKAVEMNLAGFAMTNEAFEIHRGERYAYLLILQDTLDENSGEHSEEWRRLRAELEKSFRYGD